jgi:hypothetical protein
MATMRANVSMFKYARNTADMPRWMVYRSSSWAVEVEVGTNGSVRMAEWIN